MLHVSGTANSRTNATMATNMLYFRKRLAESFANRKAPANEPIVRAAKYKLVPNPASERAMPVRSIRSLGMVVFKPTSMPTIKRIPRNKEVIYLSLKRDNVVPKVAFASSSFSFPGMVEINQTVETSVVAA